MHHGRWAAMKSTRHYIQMEKALLLSVDLPTELIRAGSLLCTPAARYVARSGVIMSLWYLSGIFKGKRLRNDRVAIPQRLNNDFKAIEEREHINYNAIVQCLCSLRIACAATARCLRSDCALLPQRFRNDRAVISR